MTRDEASELWHALNMSGRIKALHFLELQRNMATRDFNDLPATVQELLRRGWTENRVTPFNDRGAA